MRLRFLFLYSAPLFFPPALHAQPAYPYGYGASRPAQAAAPRVDQLHDEAEQAMQAGDYAEAYCIWKPLAEAGDVHAQYSLGWMYHNGYGLSINDVAALGWWRRAADQGDPDAQFALGTLFVSGDGPERDMRAAVEWFVKAARQGQEDARFALRNLVVRGEPNAKRAFLDLMDTEPEMFGQRRRVGVERANIRSGPGTGNRILITLSKGDPLIELGRRSDWIQVGLPAQAEIGWVFGTLVE